VSGVELVVGGIVVGAIVGAVRGGDPAYWAAQFRCGKAGALVRMPLAAYPVAGVAAWLGSPYFLRP
jgi:hypothetical protein